MGIINETIRFYRFPAALLLAQPLFGFCEEEETIDADDLFGGGGGYFHPYVKVTGLYDDNVYRTNRNEQSDYATVFLRASGWPCQAPVKRW